MSLPDDTPPHKRFMVFRYDCYYPCGGLSDCSGSFDTFDEAVAFVHSEGSRDTDEILDRELGIELSVPAKPKEPTMGRRITSPDMTPTQRADIARRVARVMKDDPTKTEMEALRMVFDGTDGPERCPHCDANIDELGELTTAPPKCPACKKFLWDSMADSPRQPREPIPLTEEQAAIQSAEQDIVCPSAHCASGGRIQFRDGRFICTRCREQTWSREDGLVAARVARGAKLAETDEDYECCEECG